MSIETAVFAVQRGDELLKCKGSDLADKVLPEQDLFPVQHGDTLYNGKLDKIEGDELLACTDTNGVTYKVTGAKFKSLFGSATPWEDYDIIFHVIVTDYNGINVVGAESIYNKDTGEKVAAITAPGEWVICTDGGTQIKFNGSSGTWEFGELTDTSKVTNMMNMFENCSAFNGDVRGFDTGNVTDMTAMFTNCSAFTQNVGVWDTHSLQVAMTTFKNCSNFNQDLSKWCVPNMGNPYTHMGFMDGTGPQAKEPNWGTCP